MLRICQMQLLSCFQKLGLYAPRECQFQVGAVSSGDCWGERMLLPPPNTHTGWAGNAEVHLPLETEETQKGEG